MTTVEVTMTPRKMSRTRGGDYRYSIAELGGDVIRVVICGDVVALPDQGWADAGYGRSWAPPSEEFQFDALGKMINIDEVAGWWRRLRR